MFSFSMRSMARCVKFLVLMFVFSCAMMTNTAAENSSLSVTSVETAGQSMVIHLDRDIEKYRYHVLDNPSRLVVDIYGAKPAFPDRTFLVGGSISKMRIGLYEDKTRFVLDSAQDALPTYTVEKDGNKLRIGWTEKAKSVSQSAANESVKKIEKKASNQKKPEITSVEFNIVDDFSVVSVRYKSAGDITGPVEKDNIVRFGFENAEISPSHLRIIDTSAFPSPILRVTPYIAQTRTGQKVQFAVELRGDSDYEMIREPGSLIFRVPNAGYVSSVADETVKLPVLSSAVVVEEAKPAATARVTPQAVKPAPAVAPTAPVVAGNMATPGPGPSADSNERTSLRFEKADIHMVLQLIADISGKNIIATDEVKGSVTLRLDDVPWRQALAVILEVSELGMVEEGNVIRVRPMSKIREVEQARLAANQTKEKLEPTVVRNFAINYSDLGNLVGPVKSILSERGNVTRDDRTKQLIVEDVPLRLERVEKLINTLDLPERQVMIEARIIEVDSTFSKDIGVKWGLSYTNDNATAGNSLDQGTAGLGGSFLIAPAAVSSGLSAGFGSSLTFGRLGIDSTVLDLRLSAVETSGYGKIVSKPKVTTVNGEEASIKQGTKIPYQSVGDDGRSKTEFVDADLSLKVTPVINPDRSVILDIEVTNSAIGSTVSTGAGAAPAINTKEAKNKVMVFDGETTVIGGIFVETENTGLAGVPILMDIPILGKLFQSKNKSDRQSELLIFITPKILN